MSEIFFQQLTRKQWREISGYVSHCFPICLTDRETRDTLVEFIDLVNQFCSNDGQEDDIEDEPRFDTELVDTVNSIIPDHVNGARRPSAAQDY